MLAAGCLHNTFTSGYVGVYVFWFALTMVPFLLFARHCGAVHFDRWDVTASIPFLLLIALASNIAFLFRSDGPLWRLVISVSAILCYRFTGGIRSRLPNQPAHPVRPQE